MCEEVSVGGVKGMEFARGNGRCGRVGVRGEDALVRVGVVLCGRVSAEREREN